MIFMDKRRGCYVVATALNNEATRSILMTLPLTDLRHCNIVGGVISRLSLPEKGEKRGKRSSRQDFLFIDSSTVSLKDISRLPSKKYQNTVS